MKIEKKEKPFAKTISEEEKIKQFEEKTKKTGKNKSEKAGSIYAGNLNLMQFDKVAEKKIKAKRDALRTIIDTFSMEHKLDLQEEESQNYAKALEKERVNSFEEVNRVEELKEQTKKAYNIDPDSVEQKDLELLQKERDSLKGVSNEQLTAKELARLGEMPPMTSYQKTILHLDEMEDAWKKRYDDAGKEVKMIHQGIEESKVERLKSSPMVTAQKASEKILEEASKEVIGMLKQDAIDHIDEKLEEIKKKAEEIEKKKEEQEELKKDSKPKHDMANYEDDELFDFTKIQKELNEEIRRLQKELLSDDIKGIKVNKRG